MASLWVGHTWLRYLWRNRRRSTSFLRDITSAEEKSGDSTRGLSHRSVLEAGGVWGVSRWERGQKYFEIGEVSAVSWIACRINLPQKWYFCNRDLEQKLWSHWGRRKETWRWKRHRRHGSVSLIWGSDYEGPIYKRALSWFVTTIISDVQRL